MGEGDGEIEEGKARDYTNNDDRNIDIDVALSYIVRVLAIFW